jgi:hypothetical protein
MCTVWGNGRFLKIFIVPFCRPGSRCGFGVTPPTVGPKSISTVMIVGYGLLFPIEVA